MANWLGYSIRSVERMLMTLARMGLIRFSLSLSQSLHQKLKRRPCPTSTPSHQNHPPQAHSLPPRTTLPNSDMCFTKASALLSLAHTNQKLVARKVEIKDTRARVTSSHSTRTPKSVVDCWLGLPCALSCQSTRTGTQLPLATSHRSQLTSSLLDTLQVVSYSLVCQALLLMRLGSKLQSI